MNLFQALRKRDRKALEALLQAGVDPDAECDDREMNDWTGKTPAGLCAGVGRDRNRGDAAPGWSQSRPRTAKGMSPLPSGSSGDAAPRTAWSDSHRSWSSSSKGDGTPTPRKRGKTNGPSCWRASTTTTNWPPGTLRRLLQRKVEVNARDAMGRTALMHLLGPRSAGPYQPEMLERLLEAGADSCAADNVGAPCCTMRPKATRMRRHGRRPKCSSTSGSPMSRPPTMRVGTPIDIAMRSNNESLVKFLLKHV